MILDETSLLELIERVYASAADGDWRPALRALLPAWRAGVGIVHVGGDVIGAEVGLTPDLVEDYARRYRVLDERRQRTLERPGEVLTNARMGIADEEFAQSEFYRGFARRVDSFYALGFAFLQDEEPHALSVHRPQRSGEFDDAEVAAMERLRPHVIRATQLARQLRHARQALADAETALDQLPSALVLLDGRGRPTLVNRAARRILDKRDGLWLARDGLRAATPTLTARLWDLIARAGLSAPRRPAHGGGVLRLPRPSGDLPLAVLAAPVPASTTLSASTRSAVILHLRDPSCEPQPVASRLEQLYGLTPAEARLTERLASGAPLEEAASALGVTRETVRSQLRVVFQKTDTRRQGELLRKLALDSVLLPDPGDAQE
jgi:DNA-binding CsgD family transcriptional regulator